MGSPLIAGFVKYQHGEGGSPAWIGKTTEGKASPSVCHKTAKISTASKLEPDAQTGRGTCPFVWGSVITIKAATLQGGGGGSA
jgi:hypothetical protein